MPVSQRTILFIDDKNIYNGARRAFFDPETDHFTRGGYDPVKLGGLVVERAAAAGFHRHVEEIRIYTGRPDPTRQPKVAAAHDRQARAWMQAGATVVSRPLRYIAGRAQQKGVDVALAIDVVTLAIDGAYDVGIIASTDTDLRPPIEYVLRACPSVRLEVLAWRSERSRQRLSLGKQNVWCHWLDEDDYASIADFSDYRV